MMHQNVEEEMYLPDNDDYDYLLLTSIIGSVKLKEKIGEIFDYITHQELFELMCAKPKKSFLFVGQQGTGKNFSVKAIRNELMKPGNNVIYHPYSIGRYGTAYINRGARYLQNYFDQGRMMANRGNVILYEFDEIDVIMGKRHSCDSHKEDDKLLDCLMTNLQNINSYSHNEFFFGMTNFEDALDKAAIRSGRIDDIVQFELPNKKELEKAYKMKVRETNAKHRMTAKKEIPKLIGNLNYKELAQESSEFNYADVTQIMDNVLRKVARKFIYEDDGKKSFPKIGTKNFIEEIKILNSTRYTPKKKIGF